MPLEKKITPYRRRVLTKLASDGPLTLKDTMITQNIMPTLIACGLARVTADGLYEITTAGQQALEGQ